MDRSIDFKVKRDPIAATFETFREMWLTDPSTRTIFTTERNGKRTETKLTEKQIKGFVRCWTDDETAPYYKIRAAMSKNLYVSEDILISIGGKRQTVHWIKGEVTSKGYVKYEVTRQERRTRLYLGTIYAIVTGKPVVPLESDRKKIDEMGVHALDGTNEHHIDGLKPYKKGRSHKNNERQNRNIQIIPEELHQTMHAINGKVDLNSDSKAAFDNILRVADVDILDQAIPYMIAEEDGKTRVMECPEFIEEDKATGERRIVIPCRDGNIPIEFMRNGIRYHLILDD